MGLFNLIKNYNLNKKIKPRTPEEVMNRPKGRNPTPTVTFTKTEKIIVIPNLVYLIFGINVRRTHNTDYVIFQLEAYFKAAGIKTKVSSVLRNQEEQLYLIEQEAKKRKLMRQDEILDKNRREYFEGNYYPYWQIVWSRLLAMDFLVSPPWEAQVLVNWWKNGVNQRGVLKQPSSHYTGNAFDISGKGGQVNTPDDEYAVVVLAKRNGVPIANITLEQANNAVHCLVDVTRIPTA